jgi:hypothetical protein
LVAFGFAESVAVFVKDVAVGINLYQLLAFYPLLSSGRGTYLLSLQFLWVTFNDLANDTAFKDDVSFRIDDSLREIFKRRRLNILFYFFEGLSTADNLAGIVPDIAFSVDFLPRQLLWVTFD